MTIEQHITEQANKIDLEKLTPGQREWLHFVRSLATWAYIAKVRREDEEWQAHSVKQLIAEHL